MLSGGRHRLAERREVSVVPANGGERPAAPSNSIRTQQSTVPWEESGLNERPVNRGLNDRAPSAPGSVQFGRSWVFSLRALPLPPVGVAVEPGCLCPVLLLRSAACRLPRTGSGRCRGGVRRRLLLRVPLSRVVLPWVWAPVCILAHEVPKAGERKSPMPPADAGAAEVMPDPRVRLTRPIFAAVVRRAITLVERTLRASVTWGALDSNM